MLKPEQRPEYDSFREERERRMKEQAAKNEAEKNSRTVSKNRQGRELCVHRPCLVALFPCSLNVGVLLLEAINATFGIHQFLTTSKEWMAVRADFHADIAFVRRAGWKRMSARTGDFHFVVSGMYPSFHCTDSLLAKLVLL